MGRRGAMVASIAGAATLAAVAVPGGPAGAAPAPTVLKTKLLTLQPSKTRTRLQLIASGSTVTVTLATKPKGAKAYRVLRKQRLRAALPDGATRIQLTGSQAGNLFQKNGGQGFVAWVGPAEGSGDDYAEYFGFNIDRRTIELFGVD